MKYVLLLLAALLALLVVMIARTLAFKPKEMGQLGEERLDIDEKKAEDSLAQLVRIPTISSADFEKTDKEVFIAYRKKLRELYPLVTKNSDYSEHGNTGMLFKIKGKSSAKPSVLMSHYDVVPVEEQRWQHPPFCGEIIDGELWGRGTIDTKITMMGIMEALESLLAVNFVPENDLYLSFSGDEEVAGISAPSVVEYMKANNIAPALVLDEGGAVVSGVFPGVEKPIAVIGIGEKGMGRIDFTAKSDGGHSSTPPLVTAPGKLAQSIVKIEKELFPAELTTPVREMLMRVGPYAPFGLRLVFANLWFFKPLLTANIHRLGGELNAMMRTTLAFTMLSGSKQQNVLSNEAVATANIRTINSQTIEDVRNTVQQYCHKDVTAEIVVASEASPYASCEGESWDKIAAATASTWRDAIVSPYLMIAGSDSRHFSCICKDVYKFSAMYLTKAQRGLIHNDDERVSVENIHKAVEFFTRLIKTL
ncbi:MAG: M20/M25/M40 family metallo-hydrolase [Oscillospiraceae bacterium]